MCGVEGESGLSVPEGAEAYNDSCAVAKDVVDITELARDSGRICGGGGTTLKDVGGGGDNDVVGAASTTSTAASCKIGSDAGGVCIGDCESSASTTGLGIAGLGASFTGDAKGSSGCVSAFLSPGRPCLGDGSEDGWTASTEGAAGTRGDDRAGVTAPGAGS